MIHIHARKPDGTPSYEIEDFQAITDAIRAEVGDAVIVNFSTGTIGVPVEKRIAYLRACRPEVAALNMGSMNYAKYSRSRKAVRLQHGLREPVRRDHRAARGDERARHQTRARVLRRRPRRQPRPADRHGRAAHAAARRLRDGRRRRDPADRAQPRGDGRQHPRGLPLGRDRHLARPVDARRRRAHARRLDQGRPRGQPVPARRRDGALQRRADRARRDR